MPAQELGESELSRRLQTLRRRASLVVLVVVIVTALGVAYAYSRPAVYVAKAQLVLGPRTQSQDTPDPIGMPENDPRFLPTQVLVLKGKAVRDVVIAKLGTAPRVTVAPVADSAVMEVRRYDSNPNRAAKIANVYADAYVKLRHDHAVDVFNDAAAQLDRRAKLVQEQIDALAAEVSGGPTAQLFAQENQRAALINQRDVVIGRMNLVLEQAAVQSGPPQVIDPAVAPTSAARSPGKTAVQAFVLGLILGTALAFTLEYLNPRDAGPRHR